MSKNRLCDCLNRMNFEYLYFLHIWSCSLHTLYGFVNRCNLLCREKDIPQSMVLFQKIKCMLLIKRYMVLRFQPHSPYRKRVFDCITVLLAYFICIIFNNVQINLYIAHKTVGEELDEQNLFPTPWNTWWPQKSKPLPNYQKSY